MIQMKFNSIPKITNKFFRNLRYTLYIKYFLPNKNINFQIVDLPHKKNINDNCLILIKKD